MPVKKWSKEFTSASDLPVDLTVDPSDATNPQVPADWVELPQGGTLVYKDGNGDSRTFHSTHANYVLRTPVRAITSCTGTYVRAGTGEGPDSPAQNPTPNVNVVDVTLILGTKTLATGLDLTNAKIVGAPVLKALNSTPVLGAQVLAAISGNSLVLTSYTAAGAAATTDVATYSVPLIGAV